jgi:PleD family two-component response regulator
MLAEVMGGEVFATSQVGIGSTFGLTVPLESGHQELVVSNKIVNNVDLSKVYSHRILLVEDNSVNQKLAKLMLKKLGFHCDIAANGLEAVDAIGTF